MTAALPIDSIRGKRIVLAVSGGISAYKAIEVCRRLVDAGAHVVPIMTDNAERFVGKVTFSALASEPVHTSMWDDWSGPIPHTKFGQEADLILVCPATARVIGLRVLVTAGGTREQLDPVRFIGNRSTGKQGYAFAEIAARAGAQVELITTVDLPTPAGVEVVELTTAAEMHQAALLGAERADIIVMAAAVADFRPVDPSEVKIKKSGGVPTIELERTVDILADLGSRKRPGQQLVGFAAETNDLIPNAERKLESKGADFIVANDVSVPGAGFGHDTNIVTIVAPGGVRDSLSLTSKLGVARAVLRTVVAARTPNET